MVPMLNTRDLTAALWGDGHTRHLLAGVFAIDQLPRESVTPDKRLFIVNSDIATLPGQHWMLILFTPQEDAVEFYDSLGRSPHYYDPLLTQFIFGNATFCKYNTQQLQCDNSNTCGYHCVYYGMLRCRNMSQDYVLSTYNHCSYNDKLVVDFYNTYCT